MNRSSSDANRPEWYEIRVGGRLDQRWASWFDGMTLASGDDGTTVLRGRVPDQAALHGLLNRLRDLGLPLRELVRIDGDDDATAEGLDRPERPERPGAPS